jgi:pyridoxine kinase
MKSDEVVVRYKNDTARPKLIPAHERPQPQLLTTGLHSQSFKDRFPMARILAISSQVARGSVGLSIVVPALQALGHDVIALPTVILSNHPGHAQTAGTAIEPGTLHKMLEALKANGWLTGINAVMTGYLPTVEHVAFAATAIKLTHAANPRKRVMVLCDPVLGDDPKGLYIDARAAAAIRDQLLPIADVATPNRFELSYLSAFDVRSANDALENHLECPATFATSIPSDRPDELINTMYAIGERGVARVPVRKNAPHGTGDLFAALLLSALFTQPSHESALAFATAGVDAVLAASQTGGELSIAALPQSPTLQKSEVVRTWPVEMWQRSPHDAPLIV